jgi:hypothetical protein
MTVKYVRGLKIANFYILLSLSSISDWEWTLRDSYIFYVLGFILKAALLCFRGFFPNILGAFSTQIFFQTSYKRSKNDKQLYSKKLGHMVASVHKNINVRLILLVYDVIFCMLEKHIFVDFYRFFEGASKSPFT